MPPYAGKVQDYRGFTHKISDFELHQLVYEILTNRRWSSRIFKAHSFNFKNVTLRNFHVTFMPFNPTSANFHHAFIYVFVRQNYKVNDRRPSWKSETLPLFASNTAMPEVKSTKYKTVKNIQHHTCSALHGHILAALSSELVPWGYRKICRKKSLIEKLISVRKPKQSPSLLLYHKPVSTIFTSL